MKFDFNKQSDVKIESEELLYKGFGEVRRYHLKHRLFSGGWSSILDRELIIRLPVVAALPYDPYQDKVILIQQFRVGAMNHDSPWLLEIVAGIADKPKENPEAIIRREMVEESGLEPQALHKIYDYWVSPGISNEYLSLYCVKVDAKNAGGIHGCPEEHEDIFVSAIKTQDAFDLLEAGKINNATTIVALLWLQVHKNQLDKLWK